MNTITTSQRHDLKVGDWILLSDERPWWLRLWHWIIRKKIERTMIVTSVTSTTMTVR